MGLADRDYVRSTQRTPGRLGGMRMWSVNTWLIVINVAVFFLDGVLAPNVGGVPVFYGDRVVRGATPEQIDRAEPVGEPRRWTGLRNGVEYTLVDPNTGMRVGERYVMVMQPIAAIGHFSTFKALLELQVWRFVTFQFLHADINHLIMNMIGLFFFGSLVENYLGRKRYLAYYLATGSCGALLYLILNLFGQFFPSVPGVLFNQVTTPLIGASAGVFGVLMASAFVAPNSTVLFLFVLPMRLTTLVYALVGVAALTLVSSGPNAGGEAAHLGGAISGFFLIRNTHVLRNLISTFSFGSRSGAAQRPAPRRTRPPRGPTHEEIDRVLDKVSQNGLDSLTDAERRILQRASRSDDR